MRSESRGRDIYEKGLVLECQNCKWWTYKLHFSEDAFIIYSPLYSQHIIIDIVGNKNQVPMNLPILQGQISESIRRFEKTLWKDVI